MKSHIEKTQSYLGELAGLQAKTARAEQAILDASIARLDTVQAQIKRAEAGIEGANDAAQDRYLALIEERGKLNMVIAKAHKNLS